MHLIDSEEAARVLQVSKSRLHQLTRDGYIRAKLVKDANWYDPNDVHQYTEIRDAGTTLVELAARCARAEMIAYRFERTVNQLLSVVGANIPSADLEPDAVVALHLKVEDAVADTSVPTVNDVMFWAQTFQSLSEEYLHVVARQFETEEPWMPYLDLSNHLLRGMQRSRMKNDLEFSTAYDFLDMARRGMRQTMFFYVRTTANKRIAHRTFPESLGDVHEDVLTMVSMIAD